MHRILPSQIARSFMLLVLSWNATVALAEVPRALPTGQFPTDHRLAPLKDLNGYFPYTPPRSLDEWKTRAEKVKQRILVSQGLWPMPTKTPLNAVLHGRVDCGEYSVEKVYFESVPGLYVTGNLYRPAQPKGKVPAVLFAHGHWQNARLSFETPEKLRGEIATGQERFERGGTSRFQSLCVQLARMGCIVWQWDMMSDSDAVQIPREVVHRFNTQRAEMNTTENWGFFSPQAEANLQSIMGLQSLNSVRSLDFVLSLPDVDPNRIAITGASGGGTQTMLLAAIDPRITLSFPVVMVSTAMQGGCTCENASLLRVGTGNVEFAALFAPKPQGMTTANDWTKEMSTKGFPELQKLYELFGTAKNVMLQRGEHFPHNYNAVTRSAFYTFVNRHFKLGHPEPVIERDYEPLSREELSVWDAQHPAPPAGDPQFERRLLKWFTEDAHTQLSQQATSVESLRASIGVGYEVAIGRSFEEAGVVEWDRKTKLQHDGFVEMAGLLRNTTHGEEVPVVWLYPHAWNGTAVVWLTEQGKEGLYDPQGMLRASVKKLVDAGITVVGVDLFAQGEFKADAADRDENRVVANPREFAGYTYGYNHSLLAQRVHDVLSVVRFLKTANVASHPQPDRIGLIALDSSSVVAVTARSLIGKGIDDAAIDTQGFRFASLLDYRDPRFLPGGAKYLDLPGLLALAAPQRLWLAGEGQGPEWVTKLYEQAGARQQFTTHEGSSDKVESSAIEWLLTGQGK